MTVSPSKSSGSPSLRDSAHGSAHYTPRNSTTFSMSHSIKVKELNTKVAYLSHLRDVLNDDPDSTGPNLPAPKANLPTINNDVLNTSMPRNKNVKDDLRSKNSDTNLDVATEKRAPFVKEIKKSNQRKTYGKVKSSALSAASKIRPTSDQADGQPCSPVNEMIGVDDAATKADVKHENNATKARLLADSSHQHRGNPTNRQSDKRKQHTSDSATEYLLPSQTGLASQSGNRTRSPDYPSSPSPQSNERHRLPPMKSPPIW